ncbi:MAG: helix-turn-helix domain-containing protein [Chthoniobacter sp.]|nr:helix-turn-helix domain-containing protein [Chthoniobacter sp.]
MSYPVGKKLAQARAKRGLSLDEVAHETKMRPEKILALESDDYASFPSNAYVKGFIRNYARYLGVDVGDFLATFDSYLPVSVADYQYLNHEPEEIIPVTPMRRERRAPSIVPLAVGVVVVGIALLAFWVQANAKRIFDDTTAHPKVAAQPATAPVPALPAVPPDLTAPPLALDAVATDPHPPSRNQTDDHALLEGTAGTDPADHDTVTPLPVPETNSTLAERSGANEILVASVKKTRVTVRRDDPKAPPIFDDLIYPGVQPLKLRGTRFFIESADPTSVQITKNGLPIAFQAPGVAIQ